MPLTKAQMVAMSLRSVAAHALTLSAWQRSGSPVPAEVLDHSDALYEAAMTFAEQVDADEEADAAAALPPATGCTHPEELRADFGETNGQPDWECVQVRGGCGYRSLEALAGASV